MKRNVPMGLGFLLSAVFLSACNTTPPPKPPPPNPFKEAVAALRARVSRPAAVDADLLLSRLERLAPHDPEALLAAFRDTGLILENFQSQVSDKELERMGEAPAAAKELPILQKVILDGGDGIFSFWYLHRLRSAGRYKVNPTDPAHASKGGDVVALDSRLLAARFLRNEQVFDLRKAAAWLQSPDWRVNLATGKVLLGEGYQDLSRLKRYAFDLLARQGGDAVRTAVVLPLVRGDVPKRAEAEKRSADIAARVVSAFLPWFRDGGDGSLWRELFDEWGSTVADPGLAPVERLRALEAGLLLFGHGSKFTGLVRSKGIPAPPGSGTGLESSPGAVTLVDHPRTYVKAFSPRLVEWFEEALLHAEGPALPVALAVLGGADPYLKALFSERHLGALIESILDGMASAPATLRLLAVMALEDQTGCTCAGFDPFGDEPDRLAGVEELRARFRRTAFKGLGEEIERKRRQNAVEKALETVAILQRRYFEEKRIFSGDPASLFGKPELAEAAGFSRIVDGSWRLRFGFRFEMEAGPDRFTARASGKLWDTDRESAFQYRSEVETVEIVAR